MRVSPNCARVNRRSFEILKMSAIALFACASLLFLRFAPNWAERFYPQCVLKSATGIYCPSCGTTRALKALTASDFSGAFWYNPFLFIVILPLAAYLFVIYAIRAITGNWVPSLLSSPKAVVPVAAIIAVVWIFRNFFPPA